MLLSFARIPFSTCDEACQWIHYHDLQYAVNYLHLTLLDMSSTQQVLQSEDDTLSEETLRLRSLLSQTRFSEATDPRDKVYALLGTVKHNGSIVPNYEKTKAEVFIQTVRALIGEYEHLDILSNCQYRQRRPGIPSWVPDWSKSPEQNALEWRGTDGSPFFHAAGATKPVVIVSPNLAKLILKGGRINAIKRTHPTHHGFRDTHGDSHLPTLELCQTLARSVGLDGTYQFTGQRCACAYRDTLYADLSPFSRRADDSFYNNWYPSTMEITARGEALDGDADPNEKVLKEMASMVVWAT
jgi:hypothetical protein